MPKGPIFGIEGTDNVTVPSDAGLEVIVKALVKGKFAPRSRINLVFSGSDESRAKVTGPLSE